MYKFVVSSILLIAAVIGLGIWSYSLNSKLKAANKESAGLTKSLKARDKKLENAKDMYVKALQEKDEKINSLTRINKSLDQVQTELNEKKKAIVEKDKIIEAGKKQITDLTGEKDSLNEKNLQFQKQLEQQGKDYEGIVEQLKKQRDRTQLAENRLSEIQTSKLALEKELTTTKEECEGFRTKIEKLNKLAPELTGQKINGNVQKTAESNEVASGCIIISELTKKPEIGLKMSVFHGNEFIGQVKVFRAFESSAGATITYLVKGKQVQPGDKVSTGFPDLKAKTKKTVPDTDNSK